MKNKKGAIELSVTAIVILILAIVILGLGLGFIRGMFGKVATTFEQQIAAEPEPPTPSRADMLTLSREAIITTAGSTEVVKISVYNGWAGGAGGGLSCPNVQLLAAVGLVYETARSTICSNAGCSFTDGQPGFNTQTNDQCAGTATSCPEVYIYDPPDNQLYEDQRNQVCSGVGCSYDDAGTLDGADDTCTGGGGGDSVEPSIDCGASLTLQNVKVHTKDIEPGESDTFNYVFDTGSADEGTYLCSAVLTQGPQKDITITVRR